MTGIRVRSVSDAPAPRYREEPRELTSAQKAMRVGGVLYLPHYTKPGAFVGPGTPPPPEFKWSELAKINKEMALFTQMMPKNI